MNIVIRQVNINEPEYQQVYDLREEMLRKPIGLSLKDEDLSGDVLDTILAAELNGGIIGCVMLHPTNDTRAVKLRQMAVYDEWQGKGIGRLLVEASERLMRQQDVHKIILHARVPATGFYEKLGYIITSAEFTEVGIPHVVMEKSI
jgi:N-acetylglutamate synthase-like GNAT family acetyltransferase